MRDGFRSTLKVCQPARSGLPDHETGPLIILFFSGAFITGTPDQTSQLARALVQLYGATVVSAAYRLAPEHPFPTAIHDAIDSICWAAANAGLGLDNASKILHADPKNKGFLLGGASSGGNIVAVLSRYFQKAENKALLPNVVSITGQWIGAAQLFPDDGTTAPEDLRSYFQSREQNANAPVLNAAALAGGAMALQCKDMSSELRFPSLSDSAEPLAEQPRTYIQACGMDPLRDDGLIYEEVLKRAGVQTRLDFYKGAPHAFWLVLPLEGTGSEIGREAVVDILVGFGWLLGYDTARSEIKAVL